MQRTHEHWLQLVEAKIPSKVITKMYELVDKGHTPRCSMGGIADPMFHACDCNLYAKTKAGIGTYDTRESISEQEWQRIITKANEMERLYTAWDYIKKTYFPEWDKNNRWVVGLKADLGECIGNHGQYGDCSKLYKVIYIRHIDESLMVINPTKPRLFRFPLNMVLVHEICHATTPGKGNHKSPWQNNMLGIADRAAELGDIELSKQIKKEVKEYRRYYY